MADELNTTPTIGNAETGRGLTKGEKSENTINRILDPFGLLLGQKKPKRPTQMGGSAEERQRIQEQNARVALKGEEVADQGRSRQFRAGDQFEQAGNDARMTRAAGQNALNAGRIRSTGQINDLVSFGQQRGPSEAEALMQGALGQSARNNLMVANSARGPGQAAAMAQAQRANAQQGADTSGQLAALRAREAQAAMQRELAARQGALAAQGQLNQLGLGQLGLGQQGQLAGAGGLAGVGGALTQGGVAQTGVGLNAQNQANIAQMNADMGFAASGAQQAAAEKAGQQNLIGGIIGSLLG